MKFLLKKWKNHLFGLWVKKEEDQLWLHYKGESYVWSPKKRKVKEEASSLSLKKAKIFSPFPAKVTALPVKSGSQVKKGDTLIVLSAMKMEYRFQAEASGYVKTIHTKKGDAVKKGERLLEMNYS